MVAALSTMVGVWGDRTSHGVGEKAETERNPSVQIHLQGLSLAA